MAAGPGFEAAAADRAAPVAEAGGMRSHLLEGTSAIGGRARSCTRSSTTSSTSPSTSTSSTRSLAGCDCSAAIGRASLVVPRRAITSPPPRRRTCGRRCSTTCAARARIPTAGRSPSSRTRGSLGYVFNPASFYLCRDAAGELRVVVVEVHNTHGERHLYTLRPAGRGGRVRGGDGQGVLRLAVHRDGAADTRSVSATSRVGLRIAINAAPGRRAAAGTSLVLRRGR